MFDESDPMGGSPCVSLCHKKDRFQCLPIQLFDPLAILHIAIFHITICKRWFIYKWVIAWYSYVKLRDGKCKLRTPATKGFVFSYLFVTHPFSFLCLSQRGCEPNKSGELDHLWRFQYIWEFESWRAGLITDWRRHLKWGYAGYTSRHFWSILIRRNEMIQTDFHTISVVGNWWSINRWRLLSFGFTRRPQVLSVARHLRIPSDWKKLTHHLDLNKAGHLRRIRSYCTHEGLC